MSDDNLDFECEESKRGKETYIFNMRGDNITSDNNAPHRKLSKTQWRNVGLVSGGVILTEMVSLVATFAVMIGVQSKAKTAYDKCISFVADNEISQNFGLYKFIDDLFPALVNKGDDWDSKTKKEKSLIYSNVIVSNTLGFVTGFVTRILTHGAIDKFLGVPQKGGIMSYNKAILCRDIPAQLGSMFVLQKITPDLSNRVEEKLSNYLQKQDISKNKADSVSSYLINFQIPNAIGALARAINLAGNIVHNR